MECNILAFGKKVIKKPCYKTKYKKHCYCKVSRQVLFYNALPNRNCN